MSELHPLISAIIVCTNERRFLGPALSSLRESLKGISSEIIVIDNNSSDGSRDLVREQFPDVSLIHNQENRGAAYARNMGIRSARGEYLFFLDCDTETIGQAPELLLNYMKERSDVGILSPQLLYPDHTLQYSARVFPSLFIFLLRLVWNGDLKRVHEKKYAWLRRYFMTDWDHHSLREVDWTMSAAWLIPRSAIERVGMFDEGYFYNYEDVDLAWRMKKARLKTVYYPEAQVIHHYQRLSAKGGLRNPLKWAHLKSAIRFFFKKYGLR